MVYFIQTANLQIEYVNKIHKDQRRNNAYGHM